MNDAQRVAWYAGHDAAWTVARCPYSESSPLLRSAWSDGLAEGNRKKSDGMSAADSGVPQENHDD